MRTAELFCGTKSFSTVMISNGHDTYTLDIGDEFNPDCRMDIMDLDVLARHDLVWASPPCQGFSVAAIGKNWNTDITPKSDSARLGIELLNKTIDLIQKSGSTWWFIENPRGMMRKMSCMKDFIRHTVTYCQYGDTRMKPTDIWTNAYWWKPKLACKNGDKCHQAAPRGSRTGTQGIKGAKDRGRIPAALFEEILQQMPK